MESRSRGQEGGPAAAGSPRRGRDGIHHYSIAAGSAHEVLAAVDVADAWGYLKADDVGETRDLLDRELGLLWGLTHPTEPARGSGRSTGL